MISCLKYYQYIRAYSFGVLSYLHLFELQQSRKNYIHAKAKSRLCLYYKFYHAFQLWFKNSVFSILSRKKSVVGVTDGLHVCLFQDYRLIFRKKQINTWSFFFTFPHQFKYIPQYVIYYQILKYLFTLFRYKEKSFIFSFFSFCVLYSTSPVPFHSTPPLPQICL